MRWASALRWTPPPDAYAANAGLRSRWRPEGSECQRFEVLHDGGEMELIACPGETTEPHAFKAVMNLQVSKAHLDALAFVARLEKGLRPRQPARHITGILVNIAGDLSCR